MPARPASHPPTERVSEATIALARRLRQTSADTGRVRLDRLRSNGWQICQCAAGAGLAWWLAHVVLHHSQPFFAASSAIVTLGLNWGARLSRLFEVVVGFSIGILMGDLLVHLVGHGYWQLPLIVAISMATAVLVGAGAIMSTQAGVQAVMVTTMLTTQGASRWQDGLLGGVIGIAISALAPNTTPLRRPRELAARTIRETGSLLTECAQALQDRDLERAKRALDRSRESSQGSIDELRTAASAGLDVVAMSPWFQRNHRPALRQVAELVVPLDLAMRNERTVARRVVGLIRRDQPVPVEMQRLFRDVAAACEQVARDVEDRRNRSGGANLLQGAAWESLTVPVGTSLMADVLLEQTRSMIVDLLQVAGMSYDDALAAIARPRGDDSVTGG